MRSRRRFFQRLFILAAASLVLAIFAPLSSAQDEDVITSINRVQASVDTTWVLLSGFLIFFMQAGFAMLEAGFVRQTGVVNILFENFIDAAVTALLFWAVGFGIAFGTDSSGIIGTDNFFLSGAIVFENGGVTYAGQGLNTVTLFFFQFAFAATASTIVTGSMAERTDFMGDIIYTALMAIIFYPIVVHWVWGGGWLAQRGFLDFAGSTVVHTTGGVTALIGAIMLGARQGRVFGSPPRPHNLALATLGTMILWFGWFGFNPGSTLGTSDPGLMGLVTLNTLLSASGGVVSAMFFVYARTGKWDLSYTLNGGLGGLVGITAGCAFLAPTSAVIVGLIAGIVVVLAMDALESAGIDDPVGAFPVHGVCGVLGTLAIGFLSQPELTRGRAGLLLGGGIEQLLTQALGSFSVVVFATVGALLMFGVLKALGRLRAAPEADVYGIDAHEHGATVWPDVLNIDGTPTIIPNDEEPYGVR
jgi:ammonium transporter, Amt family